MSLLQRLNPFSRKKSLILTNPTGWDFFSGGISHAGVSVNDTTALQLTASWQAIRLRSETIGTMPIHLYRRTDKGRERATEHRLYGLVKRKPNKFMTSVEFREGIGVSLNCFGHYYARLQRLGGQVFSITPLPKGCVQAKFDSDKNELTYIVTENGLQKEYPQEEILSIKGFGGVGQLEGYAPHQLHKEALGASMAAEQFAASFFGSGASAGGWIEFEKTLSPSQRDEWYKNFSEVHSGANKFHHWKLLEAGMKAVQNKVNNNDSQLLETRKHQVAEIARIYNVPVSMLMEMDRATYANAEQANLQFIKNSMNP